MTCDVVIIGGGLAGLTAALELQRAGRQCVVVAGGVSLHETPRAEYIAAGGVFLRGDFVKRGEWEGNRLMRVWTRNLGDEAIEAAHFILATGRFFSKGLVSTMDEIYEPVFGCDVRYEKDRSKWVNLDFFGVQPFEEFGVETDSTGRALINGEVAENLFVAGEILCGQKDIEQTALAVCRNIM